MRRLILYLALAALWPVPAAAAENGDIKGVITNETTGQPQAGAKVTLFHFVRDGDDPKTNSVRTDERGRYAFDELPTGDDHLYSIDVEHQNGLFQGGNHQIPDDTDERPVFEIDVQVWDTSDDPNSIVLRRNDVFLVPSEEGLAVIDSYRVVNTSDRAYIGRRGARSTTSIAFPLPQGVTGGVGLVDQPRIGIPEMRPTDFGFGITPAIPPGLTELRFSYTVEGSGGSYDLTRTALYPILDTAVFARDPLTVDSNRLREGDTVTIGNDEYVRYSTDETVDAGDPIQILAVAEAGMSPWLIAGAAIGIVSIALAVVAGVLVRRRTTKRASPRRPKPAARDREDVVVAIAQLDLRYRNGELDEEEWRTRREQLKSGVIERSPEPTP